MPSLFQFLVDATADLHRTLEEAPDVRRLADPACGLADYRRLMERLRRGLAAVEHHAFFDLPPAVAPSLAPHQATWRLGHDIGLLGGDLPPVLVEEIGDTTGLGDWSGKLGAQFSLLRLHETLAGAQAALLRRLGRPMTACLLFHRTLATGRPPLPAKLRLLVEQSAATVDWQRARIGAGRAYRTLCRGLVVAAG